MKEMREVKKLYGSKPTREGAGVRLKRAIGWGDPYEFDPFLLLDDIHSSNPDDYVAGFPWHPHRGIETVTYVLEGVVEHGDSIGNRGAIRSGDVQWMTAGSGIVHQEMPQPMKGDFRGLQLWVNLPRSHKMMRPRYRGIEAGEIPACTLPDGTVVKVVAGRFGDCEGPAGDLVRAPEYLDVEVPSGREFTHRVPAQHTCFAYVLTGEGTVGGGHGTPVSAENVVLLGPGEGIAVRAAGRGLHFLLVWGEPLHEPIAWRGPIVMNTDEELDVAFREYRDGTFIKK
jgi:quercetin 2,3-dioxygenase